MVWGWRSTCDLKWVSERETKAEERSRDGTRTPLLMQQAYAKFWRVGRGEVRAGFKHRSMACANWCYAQRLVARRRSAAIAATPIKPIADGSGAGTAVVTDAQVVPRRISS